jgi:hypothetical protein
MHAGPESTSKAAALMAALATVPGPYSLADFRPKPQPGKYKPRLPINRGRNLKNYKAVVSADGQCYLKVRGAMKKVSPMVYQIAVDRLEAMK